MTAALPDRSGAFPKENVLLAWLLLCVVLTAMAMPRILAGQLPDPDDALRMIQVRDLIAGQGWYDLVQHRINPPQGAPMHWSRLVDIPLVAMVVIAGEQATLIAVPLLTLGALTWSVGLLAHRLLGPRIVLYACLVCGILPALVMQLQPLRIDHHGWQAVCVALALLALSGPQPRIGGAWAGLAMALGASISIELLPLAAAFGAVLALRWWRDAHLSGWLVTYLQALAGGLIVLFLIARGPAAMTPWCDAISPPHLAMFAIIAIGASLTERLNPQRWALPACLGLSGIAGLAALWLQAPQCLAPPFSDLDPMVRDFWYLRVREGMPLWHQPWEQIVIAATPLLAGLAACTVLWRTSASPYRLWWAEHSALLLVALVLGLLVARSLAFAAVIAAVPLGWLLAELVQYIHKPRIGQKLAAISAILILVAPAALLMLLNQVKPQASQADKQALNHALCDVRTRAASLAQLPTGTVFAPLDLSPSILRDSPHAVVATGHHRAQTAMADVIAAFVSPPGQAYAIIAAHDADYVALCTDLVEAKLYSSSGPNGLAAMLSQGQVPGWLEPIGALTTPEFKVFRVKPGETAAPPR